MTKIEWAEMSARAAETRKELLIVCGRVLESLERNLDLDCLPETKALLRETLAKHGLEIISKCASHKFETIKNEASN